MLIRKIIIKQTTIFLGILCMTVSNIEAQPHHFNGINPYISLMDRMMKNMDTVSMSGLADLDFVRMMIPHHQGAIGMAKYEIKHGTNFQMIQLAKSIIVEQSNEILQMKLWLKNNIDIVVKDNPVYHQSLMSAMEVMMQHMPASDSLTDTDKSFAAIMIPHHQAAIDMAKVILQFGRDRMVVRLAQNIISSQQIEIDQMKSFLNQKS